MRIGLLSTTGFNIGDDLIRLGITRLLDDIIGESRYETVVVNKHDPLSVFPTGHPARALRHLPGRGQQLVTDALSGVLRSLGRSRFDDCDAIFQCCTPVLWPDCRLN